MPITQVHDDPKTQSIPCVAATAYDIGDLLYSNSGVATKVSSFADQGSAAANAAAIAPLFMGVCLSRRLATETTPAFVLVGTDVIVDADADSASYVCGEMLTVSRDATPLARVQQVAKTTTATSAIGRVFATSGGTATKVRARLKSNQI
jgi:hypothetical protein